MRKDPEEQRLDDMSLPWTKQTATLDRKDFLKNLPSEITFNVDGKRGAARVLRAGAPRKRRGSDDRPPTGMRVESRIRLFS